MVQTFSATLRYNRSVFPFRASDYGSPIAEILALAGDGHRLMPLVGGPCASEKARDMLGRLDAAELFGGKRVVSKEFAEAARSGLFLYLSCLDEAHSIAQEIHTTTGSYWHGIMHRQEPDFSNAAYWFRRVGQHEIFPALREAAIEIAGDGVPELTKKPTWDPFRFIDACEEVHRRSNAGVEEVLREIQRAEWQLLFDCCWRRAVGKEA